jgi:hypothetical protein
MNEISFSTHPSQKLVAQLRETTHSEISRGSMFDACSLSPRDGSNISSSIAARASYLYSRCFSDESIPCCECKYSRRQCIKIHMYHSGRSLYQAALHAAIMNRWWLLPITVSAQNLYCSFAEQYAQTARLHKNGHCFLSYIALT